MKAIRKSDGKIIDVEVHGWAGDCAISYHTNFKDFYKPEDLDFNVPEQTNESADDFDWQSFRAEAAKDILCAMIARGEKVKDIVVSIAIDGADKLIKELKERGEK